MGRRLRPFGDGRARNACQIMPTSGGRRAQVRPLAELALVPSVHEVFAGDRVIDDGKLDRFTVQLGVPLQGGQDLSLYVQRLGRGTDGQEVEHVGDARQPPDV